MKIKVLLLLSLCASASIQSARGDQIRQIGDQSKFDELVSIYNSGTAPSLPEIKNKYFASRKYCPKTPNHGVDGQVLFTENNQISFLSQFAALELAKVAQKYADFYQTTEASRESGYLESVNLNQDRVSRGLWKNYRIKQIKGHGASPDVRYVMAVSTQPELFFNLGELVEDEKSLGCVVELTESQYIPDDGGSLIYGP